MPQTQPEVGKSSKATGKRRAKEPVAIREVQIATLGPVAFYLLPGQPGAPYFDGTDALEFIVQWENLTSEWMDEQKVKRIIQYCERSIGKYLKTIRAYRDTEWEEFKWQLLKDFQASDSELNIVLMAGSSEASQSSSGTRKEEAMPSAIIPTRSISPLQTTQEIQSMTRRVRTLAERTLDRNLDRAEIKEKFIDLMANENYVKTQFTGILSSILSAKNQWRFLKGIVQIIEQATDSELASWGVTREEAKDELRYDELERLGRIYKSAIVKRQNNNITTEKTNKEQWVMVEDFKYVLKQDNVPPNLPLDERKYHPEYNALIVSVRQRIGGENVVSILANAELQVALQWETPSNHHHHHQEDQIRSPSPDLNIPAYRRYRIERTNDTQYDGEILDLLDNPTPEKYAKLEPEVVEDLTVADKIRDLLYEWEGIDEDSYEILPDARIIRRLNMVLNGKRLTVHPIPRNTTPPPALTKTNTILLEEYEEEEDDDDEEE
ncbi:hypothetical protein EV426DRAFT_709989 [Tirmania nivea]|nr:hypothetical protein EV426DRAFT_709989 [Tirmania nivea]